MLLALALTALALAQDPASAQAEPQPVDPLAALLSIEQPTRVLTFDAERLVQMGGSRGMRTIFRLAPGLYAPREGGLYMNGSPAGFGSLRIDGVIIDR